MSQKSYLTDIAEEMKNEVMLTNQEVFTQIWFSPRKVFRFINQTGYEKYFMLLLMLGGISNAFEQALSQNTSLAISVIVGIVGGVILGWVSYYLYAALLSWTGKWLKGEANTTEIVRVVVYGAIPSIAATLFVIPQHIIKGSGDIADAIIIVLAVIQFALAIWSLVLSVVGISEVQSFSIGRAIVNILLPIFIVGVPITILIFIVVASVFGM